MEISSSQHQSSAREACKGPVSTRASTDDQMTRTLSPSLFFSFDSHHYTYVAWGLGVKVLFFSYSAVALLKVSRHVLCVV